MKKFSSKYLADTVLSARKAKKITQQQLADRTGINRSMLSHLEAGEYIPSIPQLEALSEVLEFDLTEAFFSVKNCEKDDIANHHTDSQNTDSTANLSEKASPLKIAVAGTGYVGLSISVLLAQHHQVTAVDILPDKVEKINKKISPIQDDYLEHYLAEKSNFLES